MARPQQTDVAVLGALSIEPMSGYALREAVTSVLGHFWHESYGQIYPALKRLEADGLIERQTGTRGNSSVFSLTTAGADRLDQLLAEPMTVDRPRNPLMLRLFFGRRLGPDVCQELINEARQQATAQLAMFEAIRAEMATEPQYAADRPYWLLTVSAGEHTARATLAWADNCEATLATLSRLH
jgi:DNA-binding PadR family transcriptional regulator